jgi:hypothetical protein
MEQLNQQDNLPMEGRTTHEINHMDQHSPESISSKNGRNRRVSSTRNDWYLRKDESRDQMGGEWLKKTTVRSQDQRRILQTNTHRSPVELLETQDHEREHRTHATPM